MISNLKPTNTEFWILNTRHNLNTRNVRFQIEMLHVIISNQIKFKMNWTLKNILKNSITFILCLIFVFKFFGFLISFRVRVSWDFVVFFYFENENFLDEPGFESVKLLFDEAWCGELVVDTIWLLIKFLYRSDSRNRGYESFSMRACIRFCALSNVSNVGLRIFCAVWALISMSKLTSRGEPIATKSE